MKIRKLELKDAEAMLAWMHDQDVVRNLSTNFADKSIEDCKTFILDSWNDKLNIHMAIADDRDHYQGTVSLKHLTCDNAEFAITIGKSAMGTGISALAMKEILRLGFEEIGLKEIYWCVSPENRRAIQFYDKNGYHRTSIGRHSFPCEGYSKKQIQEFIWYHEKSSLD
ncbi:GNAT family N-acetyltransferase [Schaedlerella arabinosiphila]|jgi:diamine N-acetyltransferase|uniref:GNAT family N-acetyltransferase n=1 Tax=Schaedlerella arabinosiphila TaxID=2044587 RepID=UPI0025582722|nr:GNAT family N-acetyltransferase [Schaedlerella arabinosiphila]